VTRGLGGRRIEPWGVLLQWVRPPKPGQVVLLAPWASNLWTWLSVS